MKHIINSLMISLAFLTLLGGISTLIAMLIDWCLSNPHTGYIIVFVLWLSLAWALNVLFFNERTDP